MFIESVLSIVEENDIIKINSVPGLAFQCRIAKIRPAIHGQLLSNWSDEANEILKNISYTKKFRGTVSTLYF